MDKDWRIPLSRAGYNNSVKWRNEIVVSNGEIKPGVRTPDVIIGKVSGIKIKE